MLGSLFDNKTEKKFNKLAKNQARLDMQKNELAREAMEEISANTLKTVFEVVSIYGHPNEKDKVKDIENKYRSGEDLSFDDLINLDALYKSNINNFSNKDADDEQYDVCSEETKDKRNRAGADRADENATVS